MRGVGGFYEQLAAWASQLAVVVGKAWSHGQPGATKDGAQESKGSALGYAPPGWCAVRVRVREAPSEYELLGEPNPAALPLQ